MDVQLKKWILLSKEWGSLRADIISAGFAGEVNI